MADAAAVATHTAAARHALADRLQASAAASAPVQAAFRQVPRHLFLPELRPVLAYQDEAVVIKTGPDGVPVSSSSQPTMMALMLEQLVLASGQRVLEIGTGTGYNAALMAYLAGPSGSVVSVDIDPELTARANASLAAAGYGQVAVICADGSLGHAGQAPYDRVIVTVGADDLAPAWLEQLAAGGRIVLPLSVRGVQLSVAFERAGGHWQSQSAIRCGFIRMSGALAGAASWVPVGPQPGLRAEAGDGQQIDSAALYAALTTPGTDVGVQIPPVSRRELSDADLWLTLTEPELVRLAILGTDRMPGAPLRPLGGLATSSGPGGALGVAALMAADGLGGAAPLAIRGYGPGGAELAAYLAVQAAAWHRAGRPGLSGLRIAAFPAGTPPGHVAGELVLPRRHTVLGVGWDAP